MSKKLEVKATLGEGEAPAGVRLEVTQGPHTLRSADVPLAAGERTASAEFDVDDGDYEARATALVPHGTPATAVFAVPERVVVTAIAS